MNEKSCTRMPFGSHDTDALIGTILVVFGACILITLGQHVPNHLPTGKKAKIRSPIDRTNEVLHCGTIKVSLLLTIVTFQSNNSMLYMGRHGCIQGTNCRSWDTLSTIAAPLQVFVHISLRSCWDESNTRCGLLAGVKECCVVLYPCTRLCCGLAAAGKQEGTPSY